MFDVDKLKEAADILNNATGVKLLLQREHDAAREVITAARLVVAGQPLSWCEQHNRCQYGDHDYCSVYDDPEDAIAATCRMVEGWWMPAGKDET